jgi:hypothetical protein
MEMFCNSTPRSTISRGFFKRQIKIEEIYLILTPRGSVKSLTIKSLDIIELRDSVIVLTPPSLSLPLIKHLSASKPKCLSNVSLCLYYPNRNNLTILFLVHLSVWI